MGVLPILQPWIEKCDNGGHKCTMKRWVSKEEDEMVRKRKKMRKMRVSSKKGLGSQ